MVVLAKDNPSLLRIDINTITGTISVNDRLLDLDFTPTVRCALIIWSSIFGDKKGIPILENATEEQKRFFQQKYNQIYALMKNDSNGIYSKMLYNKSLSIRLSELKGRFKDVTDVKVVDIVNFCTKQYYKLMIPPENVFVNNAPIKDDPIWADL
jgi:hypothetical protein